MCRTQGLAAADMLLPLGQKENGEGMLSRTQQRRWEEKATLREDLAFSGRTASLL